MTERIIVSIDNTFGTIQISLKLLSDSPLQSLEFNLHRTVVGCNGFLPLDGFTSISYDTGTCTLVLGKDGT